MSEFNKGVAETEIWNEIIESTVPYQQQLKLIDRLRQNKDWKPTGKVQKRLNDWF